MCNVEIHWDDDGQTNAVLQVEVWHEGEDDDDLIGVGTVDVTKVTKDKTAGPLGYTVGLREIKGGSEHRGQVHISVAFGPPLRLAYRMTQKATKIFDVRDSFVGSLCATKRQFTGTLFRATAGPRDFVQNHKRLCQTVAVTLMAMVLGAVSVSVIVAVPLGFMALITLPIWFLPAMMASLATAPVWVPIFAIVIMLMIIVLLSFTVLALTSRPIRRRGALITKQWKDTTLGRKLLFAENPAKSS